VSPIGAGTKENPFGCVCGAFEMAIPFVIWLKALKLARNTAVCKFAHLHIPLPFTAPHSFYSGRTGIPDHSLGARFYYRGGIAFRNKREKR
jgi:hypothetical protein